MTASADRRRWRRDIGQALADLPRQIAALENAMGKFGSSFDLAAFKPAYESYDDLNAYNQVQAVERGIGRVQNYVAELAELGVKLAGLQEARGRVTGSAAERAFAALRDSQVIGAQLCGQLCRAQRARSRVEHSYLRVPAGDVHRATIIIHGAAVDFLDPYTSWVKPMLDAGDSD